MHLQENLQVLERINPDLFGRLKSFPPSIYEVKSLVSGMPTAKLGGRFWSDPYDPKLQGRNFAKEVMKQLGSEKSVMVLGLGLGYHLEPLLESGINVSVIEYDQKIFKTALIHRDISNLIKHTRLFIGLDLSRIFFEKDFLEVLSSRPLVVSFKPACQFHADYYEALLSFRRGATVPASELQHALSSLSSGKETGLGSLDERSKLLLWVLDEFKTQEVGASWKSLS
jgi:hypothetical protein